MKKTKRFVSFALALAMMFTVSSFAFAAGVIKTGSKTTPYGTLYGEISEPPGSPPGYLWLCATTSIDSDYTMALSYVKMDIVDNASGAVLATDSEAAYGSNTVSCFADADLAYSTTVYTTHEVTYTTSYVLYMYHYIG